jgi:hypothetical protein
MLKVALAKKELSVKPLSELVLLTVSELIRRLMLSMLLPKKSVWLGLPVKKVSSIPKPPPPKPLKPLKLIFIWLVFPLLKSIQNR